MPFPATEERLVRAERELGRALPKDLRERLMRDNGGTVTAVPIGAPAESDADSSWELHPVWDDSDRKRAARTASHVVHETAEARAWSGFPGEAIAVAADGSGDRLVLLPGSDDIAHWDHETGATKNVLVSWE